jgi:hypothetical protein
VSVAPALALRAGDRKRLSDLARLPSVPSGLARRAKIVLLAADGMANAEIARTVGVSRPTVIGWRDRYEAGGIAALEDEPRSGRPAEISEADVLVATLANDGRPPQRLGITRWSARFLAGELRISFSSVARIWRKMEDPAGPDRDVQVQHRPRTRAQDPRRRRAVPRPARHATLESAQGGPAQPPPTPPRHRDRVPRPGPRRPGSRPADAAPTATTRFLHPRRPLPELVWPHRTHPALSATSAGLCGPGA